MLRLQLGLVDTAECFVFSSDARMGDRVFYVDGCRIPLLVRPSESRPGVSRLVVECYTNGFLCDEPCEATGETEIL